MRLAFTLILTWGLLPGLARAEKPPVRVRHLGYLRDKGITKHFFRLALVNRHNKPVWFVLPSWPDKPLPKDGVILNQGNGQPFDKVLYGGFGGLAVEVVFEGGYRGPEFKAFHLPAKGKLIVKEYLIRARNGPRNGAKFSKIGIWESPGLKVNGKTPLEKWLPFRTFSAKKIQVAGTPLQIDAKTGKVKIGGIAVNIGGKSSGKQKLFPKEEVQNVKAEGFRLWTVKFQPQKHRPLAK